MVDAVVVVGAGVLQVPMIRTAQSMGLAVIATDANPGAPGAALAEKFVPVDTYDVRGHDLLGRMLAEETDWQVRGVVTCGADVAPSVAACAQAVGVTGLSLEVARVTHDKCAVRGALDKAGLDGYQPEWDEFCHHCVRDGSTPPYAGGFPCVVKPGEERASRGVSIVQSAEELPAALTKAAQYGPYYLIEACLVGSEHSAEVIFGDDGTVLWFNIVDRYFDYTSGVPIELGHINPTNLGDHTQQAVLLMVLAAARALGVAWGPFKVDCLLAADGPKILECTARLSGGFDCQWSSPVTGRDPMRLVLQLACGLPLTIPPALAAAVGYGAATAIIPRRAGVIRALNLPAGEMVMLVREGDRVGIPEHNAQRLGFVLEHGLDYTRTWERALAGARYIAEHLEMDDGTGTAAT